MDLFIGSMRRKGKHWFERDSEKSTDVEETGSCPSKFVFHFFINTWIGHIALQVGG